MKNILLFATSNLKKEEEIKRITPYLKNFEIKFLNELETRIEPPEENGNSFEENSLIKCKYYAMFFREFYVASEDSGLMVDFLQGAPGIYSARINSLNKDEEKVELILNMLKGVPFEKREAKFVCVVTLFEPPGSIRVFRGETEGNISFEPRGKNGFGYDPIFIPKNEKRTFAEMSDDEKDSLSHRSKALLKLKEYLIEQYNKTHIGL